MSKNIPIYLVSLKKDTRRREILKERFKKYFQTMQIIDAIDSEDITAKEYFNHTLKYYKKYNQIMSPSELGCTLSHLKVLQEFLKSDNKTAVILEDDVIGEDKDIDELNNISESLPNNALVILGGMDGLLTKYLLGKKYSFSNSLYKIPKTLHRNLNRTCCYLVTRESANTILDSQNKLLNIADKWDVFFYKTSIDIYFIKLLKHPLNTLESTIEKERNLKKKKNIKLPFKEFTRIWRRILILWDRSKFCVNRVK